MTAAGVTGNGRPGNGGTGLAVAGAVHRGGFRLEAEFEVAAGEVLGVLGPNGAGKSTLLRTLAGLTALSQGHLLLDGACLDDAERPLFVPAEKRPVGLVFQNYRLFPHLTVRDNVAFAARAGGTGRRPARHGADDWLARLGLSELATRKPGQLSGGQAQRVALARALAAEPRLLLLDEPLAALDIRTRQQVRAELRRHLVEFGGASLVVTHDPLEAMMLTDRLLVFEDGRIVQQGTPAEVARRPASQYVARLVGLNLYRGRRQPDAMVLLDDGGSLFAAASGSPDEGPAAEPVPSGSAATDQLSPSGRVLLALRPSAISLHTVRPDHSSPRNVWPGTVGGVELLADRVRIQVEGRPPALVDVTAAAVAELGLQAGSPVWLSAKATEIDCYPEQR